MNDGQRWDGGHRLRDAIRDWHGGEEGIEAFVRALQERVAATGRKVPGANRAMVQRYLGNRATPSITFLAEAAELLGVRFEWLATGVGQRIASSFPPEHLAQRLRAVAAEWRGIESVKLPWDLLEEAADRIERRP